MSKVIKIKKGLDIRLKGGAEKVCVTSEQARLFAVKPPDFVGLTPKMLVKPEQEVKAGTPLFFDKYHPEVLFTSPVSGIVKEIVRGERRRILEVVIEAGEKQVFESFPDAAPSSMEAGEVKAILLRSGLWPAIVQRPYGITADPQAKPKAIFISGFDSAPLAPDYDFILKDQDKSFAAGIEALKKLTDGKLHLSLRSGYPVASAFADLPGVEYHYFTGPHPAGNVGIQINHIDPMNKGDVVWTVNPQLVNIIGRLFTEGRLNTEMVVALAGSKVAKPKYYRTKIGVSVSSIIKGALAEGELPPRIISGNVLTGTKITANGFLGFYDSLISVIPEGDYYEMFGWAMPGLKKFSNTRAFFSWLSPGKQWDIDTNLKGGKRAFVMTGEYEKVLPMDILPVHLLKAILVEDIDKMEQLGIYEVLEEDLALCEFVCTTKNEVQEILRKGLDLMRKEMS